MTRGDDTSRTRLDAELVRRGLSPSRTQARAAIEGGCVQVDGAIVRKAGALVGAEAEIVAGAAHPWVSRGGLKLAHALDVFGVSATGRVCLDVGASTGGFTDVLLARGARRVVAVDVGRDQLAEKLRSDARVVSLESQDARGLTLDMLGEAPGLVVCDASFIGLAKVLERPLELAAAGAELVALFKPQFEVGPQHIGKGGMVRADAPVDARREDFEHWLRSRGWPVSAWAPSPVAGGDGNREWLLHAVRTPAAEV